MLGIYANSISSIFFKNSFVIMLKYFLYSVGVNNCQISGRYRFLTKPVSITEPYGISDQFSIESFAISKMIGCLTNPLILKKSSSITIQNNQSQHYIVVRN